MQNKGDPCVLEDRLCTQCGECDRCELDSTKICDNCCRCIETKADYAEIIIDDILLNEVDLKQRPSKGETNTSKFKIKTKGQK